MPWSTISTGLRPARRTRERTVHAASPVSLAVDSSALSTTLPTRREASGRW
ncbi:MAG: hypothetical protein R3A52_03980 [Polyangiales bacterium]